VGKGIKKGSPQEKKTDRGAKRQTPQLNAMAGFLLKMNRSMPGRKPGTPKDPLPKREGIKLKEESPTDPSIRGSPL